MKCTPGWIGVFFIFTCTHAGIGQTAICDQNAAGTVNRSVDMRFQLLTTESLSLTTPCYGSAFGSENEDDDAVIEWQPWHAGTMVTQVFTEALAGVIIGGFSLAILAGSMSIDVGGGGGGSRTAFGSFLLLWGGTCLGLATGAVWGGSFWDGNGRFDMSLLGAAVGLLAGIGTAVAFDETESGLAPVAAGGIIGTTCFYHLSAEPQYRPGRYRNRRNTQDHAHMSSVLLDAKHHVQVNILQIPMEF